MGHKTITLFKDEHHELVGRLAFGFKYVTVVSKGSMEWVVAVREKDMILSPEVVRREVDKVDVRPSKIREVSMMKYVEIAAVLRACIAYEESLEDYINTRRIVMGSELHDMEQEPLHFHVATSDDVGIDLMGWKMNPTVSGMQIDMTNETPPTPALDMDEPTQDEGHAEKLERIKWYTKATKMVVKDTATGSVKDEELTYHVPKDDWEFLIQQAHYVNRLKRMLGEVLDEPMSTPDYGGDVTENIKYS